MAFKLDPKLREYATDIQWQRLEALEKYGSQRNAEKHTEFSSSAIGRAKVSVEKNAARQGYAPDYGWQHPVPPGFMVKGTSTLRDAQTGEARLVWEKTTRDAEEQEMAIRASVEAMSEDIPRAKPVKAPKSVNEDLANLYVITDYHLGMLASAEETKEANYDLKIAEKLLVDSFAQMMAMAPDSETAIICQLGDFLHSDGIMAVTPTSGHLLDQDGRYWRVVKTAIRALRNIVDMALSKHKNVHVIMAEGNHDITSSIWLRAMFAALYEKDSRVTVEESPLPYYAYQHGDTALYFHHGHLRKFTGLTNLFAAQFPKIWGDTQYRYGHCGHMHHSHVKEDSGITITQHRTLSAKDAYASRGGYFAERKAECVTYHKKHGQVASTHVTPEMVQK